MRVVVGREAEVAGARLAGEVDGVFARAEQLEDREGEVLEAVGVGLVALVQEKVEGCRVGLVRQPAAVLGRDLDDARPALRRAHDAAQGRQAAGFEEAGGRAVGGDHEVLDQLLGAVLPLRGEVGDRVAVEDRAALGAVELQGAPLMPPPPQPAGGLVVDAELLLDPGHLACPLGQGAGVLQPGADGVVGQLGLVVYPRRVDLHAVDRAVRGDPELDHHGQAVLPFVQ